MSEALQGTELEYSGLQIDFKADIDKTEVCKVKLEDQNLKAFLYAGKLIESTNQFCQWNSWNFC